MGTIAALISDTMTPLEDFRVLIENRWPELSDEEIETLRDLIDMQADVILDRCLKDIKNNSHDL